MPEDPLSLADWRRKVAELYASVRAQAQADPKAAWLEFRAARESLFRMHPQTPLNARQAKAFSELHYFDYDPNWRLLAQVHPDKSGELRKIDLGPDGMFAYRPFASIRFECPRGAGELRLYWVAGYGGGLFLPFLDGTSGRSTYRGGRYLLDGIKGADLGQQGDHLVLDFNFAYNPSCAYDERWVCPLPESANRLPFEVPAGEKDFAGR